MKKVKSILKAICIILILGTIMPITANAAGEEVNLGLDKFRGTDSNTEYPAYALQNQYIFKILQKENGTKNYDRAIYCLDMGRGFSTIDSNGQQTLNMNDVTYNVSKDMLNSTDKESIISTETTQNSSFSQEDYDKIVRILKNVYISKSSDAEKKAFLDKFLKPEDFEGETKLNGNVYSYKPYNAETYFYVTDKDIEIAQQLAIWHFTNENTKSSGNPMSTYIGTEINNLYANILKSEGSTEKSEYITYEEGKNGAAQLTDYYNMSTLDKKFELLDDDINSDTWGQYNGPEEYRGYMNRFNAINEIYKNLLKTAEDSSNDNTESNTTKPLEMANTAPTVTTEGDYYIAGPFKINKNNDNYTDFSYEIKNENNENINDAIILKEDKSTSTTVKDELGNNFYIKVSKTKNTNITKIKFSFKAKYSTTTIKYWTKGGAEGTTQPVAIIDRTPQDIDGSKEVEIPKDDTPKKEPDYALRKFITGVGSKEIGSRIPKVDITNLKPNGTKETTARYVHTKEPVGVKIGDIVEYTIRVYNEGETNGYIGEIEDKLPEELTFPTSDMAETQELKDAIEYNASYAWTYDSTTKTIKTDILSKNTTNTSLQQELCKDQNKENTMLKAFDGTTLDYIDVKIKCLVNEKATTDEKITNIAQITKYEDEEGKTLDKDRDSTPNNFDLEETKQNDYEGNGNDNGYIKGKEDDDDFEKLIIQKQFDLSLRKYITDIDGAEVTERVPDVDVSKLIPNGTETTAEYNHPKKPLEVVRGSIVTYTITVYNEGEIDGYVNEITDYLPEELEFVEDSEINTKYNWKVSKDGRTVTTDYLQYKGTESTDNLIKAFDKTKLDSKSVQIQCKVKSTAEYGRIITNLSQITEQSDSNGEDMTDRDSEPDGNFTLPSDEELPKYKENEEDKKYIPGQEDDDDYEKIKVVYFDLALRKIVSKAIVTENGESVVTETNHKFEDDPEEIVKVDLGRKNLKNVTVKFEYQIRITNEGMIEGYAKEVKDYIPEGLIFNKEDNPLWQEISEGIITTDQLKDTLLQPGESAVVTVLLTWKNSQDNLGLKVNVAEISKDYNKHHTHDIDSTPDNKEDGEDDIDDAPVMLSIILGQNPKTYFGLTLLMLVTIATGIVLIKKFVL